MNMQNQNPTLEQNNEMTPEEKHYSDLFLALRDQVDTGKYEHADDAVYFSQAHLRDMCPISKGCALIERSIIRYMLADILAVHRDDGEPAYTISVHDGEDCPVAHSRSLTVVMSAIMSTDEDRLIIRHNPTRGSDRRPYVGTVYLLYGNSGWDVVCDHTAAVKPLLARTMALASGLCEAGG